MGKGACISCHSGPALTDGKSHALAVPQAGANVPPTDLGRFHDVPALLASPLNVNGPFSDDTTTTRLTGLAQNDAQKGQFVRPACAASPAPVRTCTPARSPRSPKWSPTTTRGADPGDAGIVKDPLFRPLALQGTEGADLVRFLESLSGDTMTAPLLQDTHKP